MRRYVDRMKWVILYTAIGIILFESLSIQTIIMSLILSLFALYYTDQFLIGMPFHNKYRISFVKVILYLLFLVKEMYVAGIKTLIMTLKGDINMGVVEFDTELKHPLKKAVLANSITLTPGTITIDIEDQHLTVLWIDKKASQTDQAKEIIAGAIEKRLMP